VAGTRTRRRVFLDSDVLVYAYSATDAHRRERARALADLPGAVLSTQVLGEIANVLLRKFGLPDTEVRCRITELAARCEVLPVTATMALEAFRIRQRYRLGFYDSQIVAAALAGGAEILYSEDLHHGLIVDGRLRVASPFRALAERPRARYRVRRRAGRA
jgi:predicted nucleic acid-binding protein